MQLALPLVSCAITSEYVPPARANSHGATICFHAADPKVKVVHGDQVIVDVYTYHASCPDLCYRMKSRGYEGSATILREWLPATDADGTPTEVAPAAPKGSIIVPADERVILKGEWRGSPGVLEMMSCSTAIMFRPQSGRTYDYVYSPPARGHLFCATALLERTQDADGRSVSKPVEAATFLGGENRHFQCDVDLCPRPGRQAMPSASE